LQHCSSRPWPLWMAPLLGLVLITFAYQFASSQKLDFGSPTSAGSIAGFYWVEQDPTGMPFRWSSERGTLIFRHVGKGDFHLRLFYHARRPSGLATVTITANGHDLYVVEVGGSLETHDYLIPRQVIGPSGCLAITLACAPFTAPPDTRALGVGLAWAELSRAAWPTLPPLSVAIPVVVAVTGLWLGRWRMPRPLALILALLPALGVALVVIIRLELLGTWLWLLPMGAWPIGIAAMGEQHVKSSPLGRALRSGSWHWGVVLVYFCLASVYGVIVPTWEAPDEPAHFGFIAFLDQHGFFLPKQQIGAYTEAHQPPLYYYLEAAAIGPTSPSMDAGLALNPMFPWAGNGGHDVNAFLHRGTETFPYSGLALSVHAARWISVLMASATVLLTLYMARLVFPRQGSLALLAGSLVAFNPQFLHIGSAVNNDNLLTLAATGATLVVLLILRHPHVERHWLDLGVLLGSTLLAKTLGAATAVACCLALGLITLTSHHWRSFARHWLQLAGTILLVSGWWFVRNQLLYGDPLGWAYYERVYAVNLGRGLPPFSQWLQVLGTQFRSFWGNFGWLTVLAPAWYYTGLKVLLALAGVGLVAQVFRLGSRRGDRLRLYSVAFLALSIVAEQAFILLMMSHCNQSCWQGRYYFPVLGPIAILIAWGLDTWLGQREVLRLALVSLLLGASVYIAVGVIGPAFATSVLG